jgi:hypothetical protein
MVEPVAAADSLDVNDPDFLDKLAQLEIDSVKNDVLKKTGETPSNLELKTILLSMFQEDYVKGRFLHLLEDE